MPARRSGGGRRRIWMGNGGGSGWGGGGYGWAATADLVRKFIKEKKDDAIISEYLDMENELQETLDDLSQSHEKFAVGIKVQAVWSEDGEWYNAIIEALTPNGYYVSYEGWGNKRWTLLISGHLRRKLLMLCDKLKRKLKLPKWQ